MKRTRKAKRMMTREAALEEKNRTDNSTINDSQATVHTLPFLSSPYTSGRTDVPNLVAEEGEGEGLNSNSSQFSSLDGSFENEKTKPPRYREEEVEERRTLLKNEKFLEIIGVSLANDTISTETFFKSDEEKEKMSTLVIKASDWPFDSGIPYDPIPSLACIYYIWGKMKSCPIDPKTSEIMKKAVDFAYDTLNPIFISVYLDKSLIEASEKIRIGETYGLENTSICEAVIGCFCISLLETAEYFLQYYSKERLDLLVGEKKLFRLDEIKQLNCFVRFYDELNRWDEYGMIFQAYSEYLQDELHIKGVEAWNRMSVEERIDDFKTFGRRLYQADPSCYYIIEDELEKLLEKFVRDKREYIFEKTGEEIIKPRDFHKEKKRKKRGFFGGKKTKNKSKRKSTNKKKSRKSRK